MSSSDTSARGEIELSTLVITAVASACAAYVTSVIWAPGTLASAALTPVIVALVKEALARPAKAVTRAVPVRGVVRSAYEDDPSRPPQPFEPADERVAQQGEIAGRSGSLRRRAWQTAIITGLLGFLVAAVIITVPEYVAGKSASGSGQTTLFGGHKRSSTPATDTTTDTTPTQTETAPATQTVTVPPVETTTVPPAQTTTLPSETTPLPPGETTTVPPGELPAEPPPP
jgi:hypothetical protein